MSHAAQSLAVLRNSWGAQWIGVKAPFTGTALRTVAAKLAERRVSVEDFEPVGDGIALDTTSVQKAMDSGAAIIYIEKDYKIGAVNIPSTVKKIYGPGKIIQAATGQKTFRGVGLDGLDVSGLHLVGAAAQGTHSIGDDLAFEFVSCKSVRVHGCKFENYSYYTNFFINCTDSVAYKNEYKNVGCAVRFRGCKRVAAMGNWGKGTILGTEHLSIPLGVDSTNGHAYGICEEVIFANNTFTDQAYGEGIMIHAGKKILCDSNQLLRFAFGIGVNPFNSSDICEDILLVSNILEGQTAAVWTTAEPTDVDDGIFIGGSPSTTRPKGVIAAKNIIRHFNHVVAHQNQGGIVVRYSESVLLHSNYVDDCRCNAIAVHDETKGLMIIANMLANVVANAAGTLQNGLYMNHADSKAFVDANMFIGITGANSQGIRGDAGTILLGKNHYVNVDAPVGDYGASITDRVVSLFDSGSAVDLNGKDLIEFDSTAGNISILSSSAMFKNVIHGKEYTFTNIGTANTVTIQRNATYCQTVGGANVVLGPGDSVKFIGGDAVGKLRQLTAVVSVS